MDLVAAFVHCEKLFKQERLSELRDDLGDRFLKLRSLNRSVYLKKLLEKNGIDISGVRVREQLPTAFCSQITTRQIETFIQKEYRAERKEREGVETTLVNELYKLKVFDWGGLHQNSLEKTIVDNYVKRMSSYEQIESAIENELQHSLQGYVLCSWYNHWTSILIEDIFKDHARILPVLGLIPKIDFFLDNCPFDLKVTYLPEGFISYKRKLMGLRPELTVLKQSARSNAVPIDTNLPNSKQLENLWVKLKENSPGCSVLSDLKDFRMSVVSEIECKPNELIKWLYENQGVRRFDASNRFFIVLVNTQNFFEGWKMKRAIPLLKETIKRFLDTKGEMGRECKFEWKGQEYFTKSEVLVVRN